MSGHTLPILRSHLLQIYATALEAVDGRTRVMRALEQQQAVGDVYVIAIGKAAAAMMQGAQAALGQQLKAGLLITKTGHADGFVSSPNLEVIESGHPWPTQASLAAGAALLRFIHATPENARLLFLISGGTSSLVEVLPDAIDLETLYRVNDWLLGSGLDIQAMNHIRKAISCIKGGRLAQQLNGRSTLALLISDVPGDDPATIGSGLLCPDMVFPAATSITLPPWIESIMDSRTQLPHDDDACFVNIQLDIIANLHDAKRAAAAKARTLDYVVYDHSELLQGDAEQSGRQLAHELLSGAGGLYIWGGETSVHLPDKPGRGGRNQHLALAAAIELAGVEDVVLLAAGTDGSDGPTTDAGALVDGSTLRRGVDEGLNAETALEHADAGTFLAASGDLIQTGPTGTNVMDLVLGVKQ